MTAHLSGAVPGADELAGAEAGLADEWFQMFVHPRRAGGVLLQLMRRAHGRADGRGDEPAMTVEDVLAGRGHRGTGVSSP